MKPAPFKYVRPRDLAEASAELAKSELAKLLAGGQSLCPMLNLRLARPDLLVDISQLAELRRFEETDAAWRIGAAVTHSQIEDANGELRGAALLSEVAAGIAYRSVRNLGTIGGSLAHADPAADWPLALAALDASVCARGRNGKSRRIPADSFMLGAFTTQLQTDEIIEFIEVPKRSPSVRWGYFKFCRKAGDFPDASAAAVFDPESGHAHVLAGVMNGPPQPLPELARAVAKSGAAAASQDAVEQALAQAVPALDALELRMHAASVQYAIERAFRQ